MSGGGAHVDDGVGDSNSALTDLTNTGSLGVPIPGPFVPRGCITLKQWIERAKQAANKAPDDSQSEDRAVLDCREALAKGEVKSQLLTYEGDLLPVPKHRWRSEVFWESAYMGHPTVALEPGKATQGVLIVNEAASADILGGIGFSYAEFLANATDELKLMMRALNEIPIKRGDRSISKELVMLWFEDNKKQDLDITVTLLKNMTTILLEPKIRDGGNPNPEQKVRLDKYRALTKRK